ncbi:uncharacterized protein SPAPADRAFT_67712 [Spathaspora passalidarum NRRL Y-27907]|uniref:C2H2-type domain-containing protein n=1 Tax=Spathaspora passalidarum (strain NRRL Y-27907 / 11-Y1) TaxID=619300 RepID=G3AR18_SPAPN|nr:uncharacterized protein SPAPADRAFT_67712 [Spathaspora passalidarum NRRL Y-27907]EGW31679.1 hypothetical protein SPAPADRAFT_67712 [Spathaspora passalidarum NRRL Y-27907]
MQFKMYSDSNYEFTFGSSSSLFKLGSCTSTSPPLPTIQIIPSDDSNGIDDEAIEFASSSLASILSLNCNTLESGLETEIGDSISYLNLEATTNPSVIETSLNEPKNSKLISDDAVPCLPCFDNSPLQLGTTIYSPTLEELKVEINSVLSECRNLLATVQTYHHGLNNDNTNVHTVEQVLYSQLEEVLRQAKYTLSLAPKELKSTIVNQIPELAAQFCGLDKETVSSPQLPQDIDARYTHTEILQHIPVHDFDGSIDIPPDHLAKDLDKCPRCTKFFSNSLDMKKHSISVHKHNIFKCDEKDCQKIFTRKSDKTRHVKEVHWKEKQHWCLGVSPDGQTYGCLKMFARKFQLKQHQGRKNAGNCALGLTYN